MAFQNEPTPFQPDDQAPFQPDGGGVALAPFQPDEAPDAILNPPKPPRQQPTAQPTMVTPAGGGSGGALGFVGENWFGGETRPARAYFGGGMVREDVAQAMAAKDKQFAEQATKAEEGIKAQRAEIEGLKASRRAEQVELLKQQRPDVYSITEGPTKGYAGDDLNRYVLDIAASKGWQPPETPDDAAARREAGRLERATEQVIQSELPSWSGEAAPIRKPTTMAASMQMADDETYQPPRQRTIEDYKKLPDSDPFKQAVARRAQELVFPGQEFNPSLVPLSRDTLDEIWAATKRGTVALLAPLEAGSKLATQAMAPAGGATQAAQMIAAPMQGFREANRASTDLDTFQKMGVGAVESLPLLVEQIAVSVAIPGSYMAFALPTATNVAASTYNEVFDSVVASGGSAEAANISGLGAAAANSAITLVTSRPEYSWLVSNATARDLLTKHFAQRYATLFAKGLVAESLQEGTEQIGNEVVDAVVRVANDMTPVPVEQKVENVLVAMGAAALPGGVMGTTIGQAQHRQAQAERNQQAAMDYAAQYQRQRVPIPGQPTLPPVVGVDITAPSQVQAPQYAISGSQAPPMAIPSVPAAPQTPAAATPPSGPFQPEPAVEPYTPPAIAASAAPPVSEVVPEIDQRRQASAEQRFPQPVETPVVPPAMTPEQRAARLAAYTGKPPTTPPVVEPAPPVAEPAVEPQAQPAVAAPVEAAQPPAAPSATPARQADIERIVVAARKPRMNIVPVRQLKGTDGKWYYSDQFPVNVKSTGETKVHHYAFQTKDGTTVGKQFASVDEANAWADERDAENDNDLRKALAEQDDETFARQKEYWLKEPVAPPTEPPKPATAPRPTRVTSSGIVYRQHKVNKEPNGTFWIETPDGYKQGFTKLRDAFDWVDRTAGDEEAEQPDVTVYESHADTQAKYDIYKTRVKDRGVMYAVRTSDNPRGGGDSLYPTVEEAKAAAATARTNDDANAKFQAKQKAEADERQAKEDAERAEREDIDGFDAGMTPLKRGKAIAALNSQRKRGNKVMSVRDIVREQVAGGAKIEIAPNGEARLMDSDGSFRDARMIGAIGMRYAQHLIDKRDSTAKASVPAADAKATPSAQPAPPAVEEAKGQTPFSPERWKDRGFRTAMERAIKPIAREQTKNDYEYLTFDLDENQKYALKVRLGTDEVSELYAYRSPRRPAHQLVGASDVEPGVKGVAIDGPTKGHLDTFLITDKPLSAERIYNWELETVHGSKSRVALAVDVATTIAGDGPIQMVNDSDKDRLRGVIIHPSASEPNQYRASEFDEKGFYTHDVFKTREDAVVDMTEQGYVPTDRNVVDDFSGTDEWKEGNKAVQFMQFDHRLRSNKDDTIRNQLWEIRAKEGIDAALAWARGGFKPRTTEQATPSTEAKPEAKSESPAVRQWQAFKKNTPDAIILMRMGDFYETFNEDAEALNKLLGVTITKRGDGTPMAGIPYHSVESYLKRLIKAGRRVALAEAIDPKDVKKVMADRDVTRVVQPGSMTDAPEKKTFARGQRVKWWDGDGSTGTVLTSDASGNIRVKWDEGQRQKNTANGYSKFDVPPDQLEIIEEAPEPKAAPVVQPAAPSKPKIEDIKFEAAEVVPVKSAERKAAEELATDLNNKARKARIAERSRYEDVAGTPEAIKAGDDAVAAMGEQARGKGSVRRVATVRDNAIHQFVRQDEKYRALGRKTTEIEKQMYAAQDAANKLASDENETREARKQAADDAAIAAYKEKLKPYAWYEMEKVDAGDWKEPQRKAFNEVYQEKIGEMQARANRGSAPAARVGMPKASTREMGNNASDDPNYWADGYVLVKTDAMGKKYATNKGMQQKGRNTLDVNRLFDEAAASDTSGPLKSKGVYSTSTDDGEPRINAVLTDQSGRGIVVSAEKLSTVNDMLEPDEMKIGGVTVDKKNMPVVMFFKDGKFVGFMAGTQTTAEEGLDAIRKQEEAEGEILPASFKEGYIPQTAVPTGEVERKPTPIEKLGGSEEKMLRERAKIKPDEVARMVDLQTDEGYEQYAAVNNFSTMGKNRRSSIAKFREFIKTVPEFKIDPTFVVTDDMWLKFKDGGTYTFNPESVGVILGKSVQAGDRIRFDADAIVKSKGEQVLLVGTNEEPAAKTDAEPSPAPAAEPAKQTILDKAQAALERLEKRVDESLKNLPSKLPGGRRSGSTILPQMFVGMAAKVVIKLGKAAIKVTRGVIKISSAAYDAMRQAVTNANGDNKDVERGMVVLRRMVQQAFTKTGESSAEYNPESHEAFVNEELDAAPPTPTEKADIAQAKAKSDAINTPTTDPAKTIEKAIDTAVTASERAATFETRVKERAEARKRIGELLSRVRNKQSLEKSYLEETAKLLSKILPGRTRGIQRLFLRLSRVKNAARMGKLLLAAKGVLDASEARFERDKLLNTIGGIKPVKQGPANDPTPEPAEQGPKNKPSPFARGEFDPADLSDRGPDGRPLTARTSVTPLFDSLKADAPIAGTDEVVAFLEQERKAGVSVAFDAEELAWFAQLKGKDPRELSADGYKAIRKVLQHVKFLNDQHVGTNKRYEIAELNRRAKSDAESVAASSGRLEATRQAGEYATGFMRRFGQAFLDLARMFKLAKAKELFKQYARMVKGENRFLELRNIWSGKVAKIIEKLGETGVFNARTKIVDTVGGKGVTAAERATILAHSLSPDNLEVIIDPKRGMILSQERGHAVNTIKMDMDDIVRLHENAAPWEKEFAQAFFDFINGELKQAGNDMSEKLSGVSLLDVENYMPQPNDIAQGQIDPGDMLKFMRKSFLENLGSLQPRIGSDKPLILSDIFQFAGKHTDQIARYAGMADVIREALFMVGHPDLKYALESRYGKKWVRDFHERMQALSGTLIGDDIGKFRRISGNLANSLLHLRATVYAKQVTTANTIAASGSLNAADAFKLLKYTYAVLARVGKVTDADIEAFNKLTSLSPYFKNRASSEAHELMTATPNLRALPKNKIGLLLKLIGQKLDPLMQRWDLAAAIADFQVRMESSENPGKTQEEKEQWAASETENDYRMNANPTSVLDMSNMAVWSRKNSWWLGLTFLQSQAHKQFSILADAWHDGRWAPFVSKSAGLVTTAMVGALIGGALGPGASEEDKDRKRSFMTRAFRAFARDMGGSLAPVGGQQALAAIATMLTEKNVSMSRVIGMAFDDAIGNSLLRPLTDVGVAVGSVFDKGSVRAWIGLVKAAATMMGIPGTAILDYIERHFVEENRSSGRNRNRSRGR